jgi:pyrroline-5-carboxylate reductase
MESTEPAAQLRRRVTSKGGTTEKALEQLQALGVHAAIGKAVAAAAQRSQELGAQLGSATTAKK